MELTFYWGGSQWQMIKYVRSSRIRKSGEVLEKKKKQGKGYKNDGLRILI